MPSTALKSLASKAGKSVATAEKYWREAIGDAKKRKKEGKLKKGSSPEQYAMGVVKKRLGLESADLVMFGLPAEVVIESSLMVVDEEVLGKADEMEKTVPIKTESRVSRLCSTDDQEKAVSNIEHWLRSVGKKIVGGTTIGKSPQTVVLDLTYQGGEIYVDSDGDIKVNGVKVFEERDFLVALQIGEAMEKAWMSLAIVEMYNVSKFRTKSKLFNGGLVFNESRFVALLEKKSEAELINYIRKIAPNIADRYVQRMAGVITSVK